VLKRIKKIKNKKMIIADVLLVAALALIFATTYDINRHLGLYILSAEVLAVAIMLVRSGKK